MVQRFIHDKALFMSHLAQMDESVSSFILDQILVYDDKSRHHILNAKSNCWLHQFFKCDYSIRSPVVYNNKSQRHVLSATKTRLAQSISAIFIFDLNSFGPTQQITTAISDRKTSCITGSFNFTCQVRSFSEPQSAQSARACFA